MSERVISVASYCPRASGQISGQSGGNRLARFRFLLHTLPGIHAACQ